MTEINVFSQSTFFYIDYNNKLAIVIFFVFMILTITKRLLVVYLYYIAHLNISCTLEKNDYMLILRMFFRFFPLFFILQKLHYCLY